MQHGDQLQKYCAHLTRMAFERKYPHPWLVRELQDAERSPSSFRTMAADEAPALLSSGTLALAQQLRTDPGRFGMHPVAKGANNPWVDRVLVGRAFNNDITLRHEAVSKLHAYFEKDQHGDWRLFDANSANGTQMNGHRVEGFVSVKSGAHLVFGNVPCDFLSSIDLYDLLA